MLQYSYGLVVLFMQRKPVRFLFPDMFILSSWKMLTLVATVSYPCPHIGCVFFTNSPILLCLYFQPLSHCVLPIPPPESYWNVTTWMIRHPRSIHHCYGFSWLCGGHSPLRGTLTGSALATISPVAWACTCDKLSQPERCSQPCSGHWSHSFWRKNPHHCGFTCIWRPMSLKTTVWRYPIRRLYFLNINYKNHFNQSKARSSCCRVENCQRFEISPTGDQKDSISGGHFLW